MTIAAGLELEAITTRGTSSLFGATVVSATAATLRCEDGTEYLDLTGALGSNLLGYDHEGVRAAQVDQLERVAHVAWQFPNDAKVSLMNALAPSFPPETEFLFSVTGAEAVEGALKIARSYTGGRGVLAFSGSYHGKTESTLTLTASPRLRQGMLSSRDSLLRMPYPTDLGLGQDASLNDTHRALSVIESILSAPEQAMGELAGIIVEGVQGGAMTAPHIEFLRGLRDLTERSGLLLIADEVFSGLGRTGRMFSYEHSGIQPDLVVLGKGLGGGVPVSIIAGHKKLMSALGPALHTSTFAGNALACAAGVATLAAVRAPDFMPRIRKIHSLFEQLVADSGGHWTVSGRGIMVGLTKTGPGAATIAERVQRGLQQQRFLMLRNGATLRLSPPACITDAEIRGFIQALNHQTVDTLGGVAVTR